MLNIKKIDKKKEIEGVWFEYDDEIKFKIARIDNPEYTKELYKELKPHQKRLQRGKEIDPEKFKAILVSIMAKTILLDWEGITEIDQKTEEETIVPYSYEKAVELLSDEGLNHVLDEISEFAKDNKNYYEDTLKEGIETAKKS